ncbi:unnamed protein product [Pleuronectes platessa]|uniref:Uncharacterized protein n=1 Tax=Pleuronectes platessa TaxID=8262 RepID=A0A9N7TYK0_PLEPL|nr:unnamed protein product [Pleuronectes platessa]
MLGLEERVSIETKTTAAHGLRGCERKEQSHGPFDSGREGCGDDRGRTSSEGRRKRDHSGPTLLCVRRMTWWPSNIMSEACLDWNYL